MSQEWYILQYKSNSHQIAKKNLNQQMFKTFLPQYDTTAIKASRFKSAIKPLFPGYMFVMFDRSNTKWQKINNTYGVSRLITFNSILRPVPKSVINNLMERYDLSSTSLPINKYNKGDKVKISKGPFANFVATIEKYEDDRRMWVLMDLMGRKSKIQTAINTLNLID